MQTIEVDDGRLIAYGEWGDVGGRPMFLLHGTPGCRLSRHPDATLYPTLDFTSSRSTGQAMASRPLFPNVESATPRTTCQLLPTNLASSGSSLSAAPAAARSRVPRTWEIGFSDVRPSRRPHH
jgi:hypothetical protein